MRNEGRLFNPSSALWNGRNFSLLFMGAGVCMLPFIIGFISAQMSPVMSQQGAIVLALVFPAFVLAVIQSRALIPYTLVVWAVGPEIRRISDWMEGTYHSVSLLSIAPLLTSAMILIPVLRGIHQAQRPLAKIVLYLGIALGYGSLIGVAKNGTGFAYDLANYVIPLMILPYFATRAFDTKDIDRLLSTYANLAVAVSVYGIIQYMTVPPWDAFWMNYVQMNSIGLPYPLEIRVFSTLNSPGPCAFFLAGALMPMLMERRWRGSLGWVGVVLTLVCLMTTLVRSAWLLVFIMLLAYILTSSTKGKWKTIFQMVVLGALLVYMIPKLPGAEGLVARMETLTSLEQDRSYNDRMNLLNTMLPVVTGNPLGKGLGSVGTGTKLDNGGELGTLGIMDNGFIALFLTLGVPGVTFFIAGLFLIAKKLVFRIMARNSVHLYARLGFAAWSGACANLISDNGFPGLRGYVVWVLVGIGLWAKDAVAERR